MVWVPQNTTFTKTKCEPVDAPECRSKKLWTAANCVHFQHDCLGCLDGQWAQMVVLRQLETKGLSQRIKRGQVGIQIFQDEEWVNLWFPTTTFTLDYNSNVLEENGIFLKKEPYTDAIFFQITATKYRMLGWPWWRMQSKKLPSHFLWKPKPGPGVPWFQGQFLNTWQCFTQKETL